MAGASIHISEEMIKLSFLECFQIMMFLRYFFVTLPQFSASFFFFFFFFFKVQSKIGVRIIHGRALYTGVHYTRACIIHGRALYTGKYGKWQGIDLHPFYRSLASSSYCLQCMPPAFDGSC